MDKTQTAIHRGARAEALLKDEIMAETFAGVRSAIIDQWATCPLRDKEGAHELRLMLKLLDDVKGNIERIARDGVLAKAELEIKRTKAEKIKRAIRGL